MVLQFGSFPVTIGPDPTRSRLRQQTYMRTIASSNDPVRLSFLVALLEDAGIDCILLDSHASGMDGSIGAIMRRLVVADDDEGRARRVLREAGEA
jgi:hypothetical protein